MGRKVKKEESVDAEVVHDGPPTDAEFTSTDTAIVFPAIPAPEPPKDLTPPPAPTEKAVVTMKADMMMKCNTCFLKDACAVYKPDSDCNLGIKVDIEDGKDVMAFTKQMLRISGERVMRAYHFELTNGGVMSPEVKEAMEQFMELTRMLKELGDNRESIDLKVKGGPGIISQIFGGMLKKGG